MPLFFEMTEKNETNGKEIEKNNGKDKENKNEGETKKKIKNEKESIKIKEMKKSINNDYNNTNNFTTKISINNQEFSTFTLDLDTKLSFPCNAKKYYKESICPHIKIFKKNHQFFRIISAENFLKNFSSDR